MKTKMFLASIIGVLFFALSGCGAQADDDVIVIRLGHVLSPDSTFQVASERFKEVLEEISPYPVEVRIFHSAQLGNERDMAEGLQLGTLDMALIPGAIGLFEPLMDVFALPFIFDNRDHAYRVLDGEIGHEVAAKLPDNGIRLLSYWENGFRSITNSRRPISMPEDLSHIRMRLPENEVMIAAFNNFNANVLTIPSSEIYAALQQGVADAQENPLSNIISSRVYEVQDYLSLSNHIYLPLHLAMSEAKWQTFPPELQEAIMEAATIARDYQRQFIADTEDENLEYLSQFVTINEVDQAAFQLASEPVWEQFEENFGDLIKRIRAYADH